MYIPTSLRTLTPVAAATAFTLFFALLRALIIRYRRRCLRGAHVWVIGASQGLGRAIARAFVAEGSLVTISARRRAPLDALQRDSLGKSHLIRTETTHSRDERKALKTKEATSLADKQSNPEFSDDVCSIDACKSSGNIHAVVPFDVTSPVGVLRDVVASVTATTPLDIVVVNAGINNSNLPFNSLSLDRIDTVLDTNLRGPARLAALTHPALRRSRGSFVIVSSLAGYRGLPGASIYGASKAGVTTLCQSLSIEWARDQIDVVCVHPGFVDTPAIRSLEHPKPLLVSDVDAARCVVQAVRNRQSHVGFPWLMEHVVMGFARIVPTPLYNFIMARVG